MANEFDAKKEIVHIIDDIRHYFAQNGNPNIKAVIGISGGKDSTIAATLLAMALGSDRVVGVTMPQGSQPDIEDSDRVIEMLGIKHMKVNIGNAYDALTGDLGVINDNIRTNLPARLRMATLYAVASCVEGGGRVINTGNASEAYVGYTTKYGDLAGDYAILRGYYVTEIYQIGEALEWVDAAGNICHIPHDLIHKAPADGMSGKTDEDNMGFTYEELDAYLIDGLTPAADVLHNITTRHNRNKHKEVINLPHPYATTRPFKNKYGGCFEVLSPFDNDD